MSVIINGQAQQVTLNAFPVLIGRDSSSCGLPISEPAVSRRHARFTLENGNLYIEDVSEHNGTFINGSKLPPLGRSKINAGDKVKLKSLLIRFYIKNCIDLQFFFFILSLQNWMMCQ